MTNEELEKLITTFPAACEAKGVLGATNALKNVGTPIEVIIDLLKARGSNPIRTASGMNVPGEILLFNDEKGKQVSVSWDPRLDDINPLTL
jgi:hypothetical protein